MYKGHPVTGSIERMNRRIQIFLEKMKYSSSTGKTVNTMLQSIFASICNCILQLPPHLAKNKTSEDYVFTTPTSIKSIGYNQGCSSETMENCTDVKSLDETYFSKSKQERRGKLLMDWIRIHITESLTQTSKSGHEK